MKTKIKELVRIVLMLTGIGLANGAWATLSPGDTVPGLSNTGTANTTSKYSECCFSFCIPATSDLPEGTIVKVKKIKFAEVATHGTNENNPYYLALNTCKSDAVVVDSSNKIQANDSTSCNTLIYTFTEKDCLIKVGTTYTQLGAEGAYNNQRFDAGKGLTFLHSNGNRWSSGTTMQCAVTYVNTSDSDSVIASTSSSGAGYYPVYEIEAEVVDPLTPDFEYNATVGSISVTTASANWVGDLTNKETNRCRIGPNGAGLVYDMGGTSTPYGNMSAKSGQFSFAVYADVAQVPSTGKKRVLVSFSKNNYTKLVLYREGDNLKFGLFSNQNAGIGAHATLPVPSAGFHLIAGVCDLSTATVSLYVDSSSDTQSQGSSYTLSNGFQLSAIYENDTAYDKGENFALSKFMGYDRALTAEEVATLSSRYPATDGTQITADISPSISEKTLTVYDSEATGNQYLGITAGTLTIPANNTVTVPQMRVMNTGSVTVNINGTVEIDSSMDSLPATGEAFISGYKGILLGGVDAAVKGTYNITGTIDASDAYLWGAYAGDDQTININGGRVSVKGLYDGGKYVTSYAKVYLTNGGTLEVGELLPGTDYRSQFYFGNGTYKVLSSGTDTRVIQFEAGENEYTTLDPSGCILTLPSYANISVGSANCSKTAIKGSGDIKVASSVSGGKVKFNSLTTDYTGNITVAANSTMELVAGAYAGTITVETGGTLEINPGSGIDYTCSATIAGAGSVVIKSGNVTLATAPTVTSAISVDTGAKLILPTGTVAGVSGSGELNIPNNVVVTVTTANAITVGSLTGTGTLLMSGIGPGSSNTTLQNLLKNGNWDGTFAIANVTRTDSNGLKAMNLHLWGNAGSKLKLIGVKGYFNRTTTAEQVAAQPELVLENGTGDYAYGYKVDDGWSYTISGNRNDTNYAIIRKLSGTGKLLDDCNPSQLYVINDASDFSGSIEQGTRGSPYGKTFVFSPSITPSTLPGNGTTTSFDGTKATAGTIDVRSDATIAMANGSTWQSQNGIRIAGEVVLKGSATMSSPVIMVADAKLTFKAGAVLNAISVALPASGTVAVDVSAIADSITSSGVTLITSTGNIDSETDISALTVTSGYFLKAETDVLKVYPLAATVNDASTGDVLQSFATVEDAIIYAGQSAYTRYVVVKADATVESSVAPVLIDADGVTLNLTYSGLEYQYSSSPTGVGNIYVYQKVDKAADYTWDETPTDDLWGTQANWLVGGDTATRPPRNAGDTATFESDETVELGATISIKELNISSAVMLTASGSVIEGGGSVNFSATDGITLTAAGASLTVRSVNLSATPTTDVEGYYVKRTTGSGTTTYTAVLAIASAVINEETVYFDDIDDAFDVINANHSVTVTLINASGDYDEYDTEIATRGFFREGAVVKFLAATVNDANTGDVLQSFATVEDAIIYAGQSAYTRYVVVKADATVESSVAPVLIDADGVTLNLTYSGLEYQYSSSPTGVGNIYVYQKVDKAADYTWDETPTDDLWGTQANWLVGGDTATRPPRNAGDTATFESDETVELGATISIKELNISSAVMLTASGSVIEGGGSVNFSATDGITLTAAGASLTVRSVNLSATPTTDVEGYYVKRATGSGTTTYTVTAIAASVTDSGSNVTYYDSLATAVSSASTGDSIALFANSSEAITLNDKTINFSEGSYTFSGTFTGNGTVVLGAALKSASSDRWPVGWTGTVELKGITSVIADFNFAHYGNANSTVKANNVLIRLNPEATGTDVGCVGAIEVASGGLKFGGTKIVDKIFYISATITGSGTISVGTPGGETDDAAHKATCTKYVFSGDYSAFRGAVNFSGASSYRAGIVFRYGSDTIPTQTDWGQIIVTENATLTTSGTLDGAGGFVIEGEIDLLSGGSVTTGGAKIGGDGLIVLTEGSSGALASSKFNSAKWTGVVELKNITTAIDSFDFVNYGTAKSTVRANGVTVNENDGAIGNVGCIDVAAGGLTFGNSSVWKNGKTISIAADITGSGLIVVATPVNAAHGYTYYVFTGDVSGFAGSVRAQSAWSPTYDSVIVFKDAEDEMPTATAYRQMFVTENASVNIGAFATWTASTLTVDGTMNIASGGILSGTVKGSGKITYAAYPASAPSLDNAWSGTVALPAWITSAAFDINAYGKAGSTIELAGMSSGWIKLAAKDVNPDLYLTGYFCPASMSEQTYTFRKITGTGSIAFPSSSPTGISISEFAKIDGYEGSIVNNSTATLSIGTLSLPAGADVSCGAKLLSTGGTGTITVGSITVGGVALSNVSYSRNTSGAEGDGFYVNAAATTTGTGESAVTTVTTDGSTTSVAVTLDNDYSGKIAVPANVATLTVTGPTITAGQLQLVTTQGTYDNLLSYSAGAVSLNPSAYYQNGEGEANKIYVEPKTAASDPMTMPGATTAPSFNIKTIPGLYYVVRSGTDPSSLTAGSATQATTTTTGLAGPALGNEDTVRYYKISVGRTAAEAQQ